MPGFASKYVLVRRARAEEEGDAVVRARDDQRDVAGRDAHQAVVAPGVAQEDGLVAGVGIHGVDRGLDAGDHVRGLQVVQSLAEELHVDERGARGRQPARLAVDDLAADELQPALLGGRGKANHRGSRYTETRPGEAGRRTGGNAPTPGFDWSRRREYVSAIMYTVTKRERAFTLAGIMVALFLGALDQTIVATAMPRILQELNGLSLYTWVVTAYLLASTAMIPIYGKLSDLYGRKVVVLVGVLLFLAGSVLSGQSQSMTELIIFRAVQGLGSAGIFSTAFTVVADLFTPGGARQVPGPLRRGLRDGQRPGPVAGRTPHGQPVLAMGLLRQPSRRPGGALLHHLPDARAEAEAGPQGEHRLVGIRHAPPRRRPPPPGPEPGRPGVSLAIRADHRALCAGRGRGRGLHPGGEASPGAHPPVRPVPEPHLRHRQCRGPDDRGDRVLRRHSLPAHLHGHGRRRLGERRRPHRHAHDDRHGHLELRLGTAREPGGEVQDLPSRGAGSSCSRATSSCRA